MGIDIIIWNHIGDCSIAYNELVKEVTTLEVAEALAVCRALSLAEDEGFDKMVIASDCLSLVQQINSLELD
jgi:ribonuclease HI